VLIGTGLRQLKVGVSGVRGVVGEAMTPELVVDFACAFGTYCGGGPVVVGRDTRASSSMFHAAVLSALISAGADVLDLGVCPTPVVAHTVRRVCAPGGISITGSHNDARWNALKFIGPEGALLNAANSEELLDIYHASAFELASWQDLGKVRAAEDPFGDYLKTLYEAVDAEAIRRRGFRIAVDFCNGAAMEPVKRFLERLGCRLVALNDDADGVFAHPPAPSPANMRQLAALLRSIEADLGAAINVDGDRLGLVLGTGEALSEECVLPLIGRYVIPRRPGPVVTNLSTSRMIEHVAREYGRQCIRTNVGEGFVMDRALTEDAALAGEGNGGVAVLPHTATFDALLSLATVLEAMAVRNCSLEELTAGLPRLYMRKAELPCAPADVYRVLDGFRQRYAEASPDLTDGVRFEWPDAWLHVRASNTEPLLRVIAEADSEERLESLFEETLALARRAVWTPGGR